VNFIISDFLPTWSDRLEHSEMKNFSVDVSSKGPEDSVNSGGPHLTAASTSAGKTRAGIGISGLSGLAAKLVLVLLLGVMTLTASTMTPSAVEASGPVESSAAACPSVKHRTIQRGNTGKAVKHAQCLLNYYWGYNLKVDGIFGKKTESAIKHVQWSWDMKQDGIVGRCTWRVLHAHVPPDGC
jgi:zinc D-Ala-D-Ala carboxypeptidase